MASRKKKAAAGKKIHLENVRSELKRVQSQLKDHSKGLEAGAKKIINAKIRVVKRLLTLAECKRFVPGGSG